MAETLFDLSEVDSAVAGPFPDRLREMHVIRGFGPAGAVCGGCAHLITMKRGGTYFKCDLSRVTGGAGSDWRKSWPACGAFVVGDQVTVYKG